MRANVCIKSLYSTLVRQCNKEIQKSNDREKKDMLFNLMRMRMKSLELDPKR